MAEAIALGAGARGRTAPNPNVGCVIVSNEEVVGRGATERGGRPHAEAVALAEAGERARGATLYTSLEPCAHRSQRGPTCAHLIIDAGVSRVVAALQDPDERTAGDGVRQLRDAGIQVDVGEGANPAAESMPGWLTRLRLRRPRVTLKLALSIDGKVALPSGESKWITGEDARAHVHLERAHSDMILVGRGTLLADRPRLDVRLPGLEEWSPRRALLTRGEPVEGWEILRSPEDVYRLHDVNDLLVEGGSATATAFLAADLVDRILLYRAPIIIGEGKQSVGYIGLDAIGDAHGRWIARDGRPLGIDRLEVYERVRGVTPAQAGVHLLNKPQEQQAGNALPSSRE
ncbi:bifunctional diaminohydroxyphosphoribosylaminopyrimidine deaminase/5-amino-6-(5-phosphoribosylamino)uracil reductase RibD [Sphingomonas arenae]|uniref:bifunctional diaminohydroxyphosphoribosylaminopyrimidine deaminase/5-amino-6-(5-phosphoribosylamino)uracil reductase RibD n=1 Tax=Sphingomonas arenae TaxID=2812555 RepID=UPI0019677CDA|nr:bifunctional diaminohydroxyphosphoribosylaminopyrimidine deaminase/5-amino-6-(5-phosphoribosylamino)uracil reductase RibD [Sphingomonas arenae]